jgi:SSS family solute:Na+ symporter
MIMSFSIFMGFRFNLIGPELAGVLTLSATPSDMTRNLWQAIWAWAVTFGVTVLISLFTTPKTDAELVGLVKGMTPKVDEGKVWLLGRPGFWAAVALVVVIALNAYFW